MRGMKRYMGVVKEIRNKLNESNNKLVNLMISGSYLYGFPSKDSDIDFRGMFLFDTNLLLGLRRPRDVIEMEIGLNDIVLNEVGKEIGLCLAGNCNAFERLNGPQIVSSAEFLKLRKLLNGCMAKDGLYKSYKGIATSNYKKFIKSGRGTIKKYLYVFRGLMAGIYALERGRVEPNIEVLNRRMRIAEVEKLVKLKKAGKENENLPRSLSERRLEKRIDELFERIDMDYEKSKLAERPDEQDVEKVNKFLIKVRKKNL